MPLVNMPLSADDKLVWCKLIYGRKEAGTRFPTIQSFLPTGSFAEQIASRLNEIQSSRQYRGPAARKNLKKKKKNESAQRHPK